MELTHLLSALLLLSPHALAESLYSSSSAVLQISARTYSTLIEKSNYTSIVEFYAPWCGHCKSLKPAYEKAAASLAGYGNVAAINCDEDSNKAFCGSMGVQGFPTLKLIRPKKKGGKPLVEDYNGERSAKAIREAVLDKTPNHVQKLTDDTLDRWLARNIDRPKVVFLSEKSTISPLVKSIAIDFLGAIDVAQVHSKQELAAGRFMVEKFPSVVFMASGEHVPELYSGEMNKAAIMEWLKSTGVVEPNPDASKGKAEKAKKTKKNDAKTKKPSSASSESASCPVGSDKPKPAAASETLNDESNPTESPDPNLAAESPAPIPLPVEPVADLQSLDSEAALHKNCLNVKSGTCVLAIQSAGPEADSTATTALSEIAHKHAQRKSKLFPFYTVPDTNAAGQGLISALGIRDTSIPVTLVAVNAKRGWWTQYTGSEMGRDALETWVDNIRFGDFNKRTLPAGAVKQAEEQVVEEEKKEEEADEEKVQGREERKAPENPIKIEKVEVVEDFVAPEHGEL